MATDSPDYATYWVCQCCFLMHVRGSCRDSDDHGIDGCEPLSQIPGTAEVRAGLLVGEHHGSCTEYDRTEGRCTCESRTFSWSSCDGCGSSLSGDRHALTVVDGTQVPSTDSLSAAIDGDPWRADN